jgi:hypothetical protein
MTRPQEVEGGYCDTPSNLGGLEQRKLLPGAGSDTTPVSVAERKTHWLETVSRTSESRVFLAIRGVKSPGIIPECPLPRLMLWTDLRGFRL